MRSVITDTQLADTPTLETALETIHNAERNIAEELRVRWIRETLGLADQFTRAAIPSIGRGRRAIASTAAVRLRREARAQFESTLRDAAEAGYRADQSARASAYAAFTTDAVDVSETAPTTRELEAVRGIAPDGADAALWAEAISTQLWASALAAVVRSIDALTGGQETGAQSARDRLQGVFDTVAGQIADLAVRFFMAGVGASVRQVADAFAAPDITE